MNLFKIKKLLVLFSALTLFSCNNDHDPYYFLRPQLPYDQPFKFAKAGEKTTIDFWVLPTKQKVDGSEPFGVTFEYFYPNESKEREMESAFPMTEMEAQLYRVENGNELEPMAFRAYKNKSLFKPTNAEDEQDYFVEDVPAGSSGVSPHLIAGGFGSDVYRILTFSPSRYGQYRLVVSVKQDTPLIEQSAFAIHIGSNHFGKR
jgi:hypothetical protein